MTAFRKSLLVAASSCGCVTAVEMIPACLFAHMSVTSKWAQAASVYCSIIGLALFVLFTVATLVLLRFPTSDVRSGAPNKTCPYATASVVLGFPLFGMMTWGISSLGGIACGVVALHRICRVQDSVGRDLAITGICMSYGVLPLIPIMLLFVGPD